MTLRDKILKAAYELFTEKGYDKATVAEIIDKVGTSKGGFYHHFKSKDEILEEITLSYIKDVQKHYDEILNNKNMTLTQKFTESFYRIIKIKTDYIPELPKMRKLFTFSGNHVLLKKIAEQFEDTTTDFYYNLIVIGNKSGEFNTQYPYELASLWSREIIKFHRVARNLYLVNNDEDDKSFKRMLEFNEQLINHQLGLKENKIELVSLGTEYIETIRAAFIREEE